jgi:hypothetical protein
MGKLPITGKAFDGLVLDPIPFQSFTESDPNEGENSPPNL